MRKEEQMLLDFKGTERKGTERLIDSFLHPTSNQDIRCPHIEWMGEDLVHCPGVGEWKCRLQQYKYGDQYGDSNTDYKVCSSASHKSCQYYLAQQNKAGSQA